MHKKHEFVAAVVLGTLLIGCSLIPRTHAETSAEISTVSDSEGRPCIASWWDRAAGVRVLALFLPTRWMDPIPGSLVVNLPDSATRVVFGNPTPGPTTKDVPPGPTKDTINEDINPFDNVAVGDPEDSDPSVEE
jgi:hypothetical protein